ncbi:hypothetical protein [Streptomyces cyaneofuscatus]|uniref:hypothetical protein n=1 Tax=Streptomyces cyaneofuscatus TaxID=66883 RepID=UPI00365F7CB3
MVTSPLLDGLCRPTESLARLISGRAETEVFWAALHGLATLTRAGRLPSEDTGRRVERLAVA